MNLLRRIRSRLELSLGTTLFYELDLIKSQVRQINTRLSQAPVFVMVIAPGGAILSRRIVPNPGPEATPCIFHPLTELPAGLTIVTLGEGYMTDVTIGNMAQMLSYGESPLCITQTPVPRDTRICVRVKGNFQ